MTRTERTYYLVFGLYNASWSCIGPIYALFLLDRGLDLFEITLVLATYLITAFLFEVPTGAVADVFGRKASFLLSCVIRMIAFALYSLCDSLGEFIVAEFIDAIGTTLATGALDAWAVDGTRAEGGSCSTDRLFARAAVLSRAVMVLGGVAGATLADTDLAIPWLVGAACFGLTAATGMLLMRETRQPYRGRTADRVTLWEQMHGAVGIVRASPFLWVLCLLTGLTAVATLPIYMYWPPRMQSIAGEGYAIMGWIWALINVFALVGSALVPRLLRSVSRPFALAAAALWRAVTLVLAALAAGFFPALTGLLLQEAGLGMSEPLQQAWMNDHVDARNRATILSLRAMAFTSGGALGLLCLGLVARSAGIPLAWLIASFVLLLTVPGWFLLGRLARPSPAGGRTASVAGPEVALRRLTE